MQSKGVKVELALCLIKAVDNKIPLVTDLDNTLVGNLAGERFFLGAIWEIEGADEDDIYTEEGVRNIGGEELREPTAQPAEFVSGDGGAI